METKFESSSSLGNLTNKGFFFFFEEKENFFKRERKRMEAYSQSWEGKAKREREVGESKGLENSTLIIIAEYW